MEVPGWARLAFGASGPLIGFVGVAQTLGSLAALAGGAAIALTVHRSEPAATPPTTPSTAGPAATLVD